MHGFINTLVAFEYVLIFQNFKKIFYECRKNLAYFGQQIRT